MDSFAERTSRLVERRNFLSKWGAIQRTSSWDERPCLPRAITARLSGHRFVIYSFSFAKSENEHAPRRPSQLEGAGLKIVTSKHEGSAIGQSDKHRSVLKRKPVFLFFPRLKPASKVGANTFAYIYLPTIEKNKGFRSFTFSCPL